MNKYKYKQDINTRCIYSGECLLYKKNDYMCDTNQEMCQSYFSHLNRDIVKQKRNELHVHPSLETKVLSEPVEDNTAYKLDQ